MRLDWLHRAYPSLHPFGVVHWVPVLSNIKTATGCESNRQLQLWTVFAGTVVNNYQFNGIQGWTGQWAAMSNKMPGCHLANAWRSRSKHILQWWYYTAMKYQFIHSFIRISNMVEIEMEREDYYYYLYSGITSTPFQLSEVHTAMFSVCVGVCEVQFQVVYSMLKSSAVVEFCLHTVYAVICT